MLDYRRQVGAPGNAYLVRRLDDGPCANRGESIHSISAVTRTIEIPGNGKSDSEVRVIRSAGTIVTEKLGKAPEIFDE